MTKIQDTEKLDVIVIGAGIAGLYLLYRLRNLGLQVKGVDKAGGVGGTWYWNRYPGARCDVDSMFYSYQFDHDLEQEWEWTERYASQAEILDYLNHVADRFNLRENIEFNTSIVSAHYHYQSRSWKLKTQDGVEIICSFCIMATGCLSEAITPKLAGLDEFSGNIYHTAYWPHTDVDFSGLKVGLIGTGSSGVQAIPEIAKQAQHLTVFQRTANYVVPAQNRPLNPPEIQELKANYKKLRELAKTTPGGFSFFPNEKSALSATPEERDAEFERRWEAGGIPFMGAFSDLTLNLDANKMAQDFVRKKIREIVNDQRVAERLSPDNIIGCKRLCVDTGYFETFNRTNVDLIDVNRHPIERITENGIQTSEDVFQLDALVFATGFDAMTGALNRIDIRGREGLSLKKEWYAGPRTYLGLAMAGFPNLFIITGPGSPSVLSNMMPTIEQHVEWISDCIAHLKRHGLSEIEVNKDAQDEWVNHVNDVAAKTLRFGCNSWYLGANVPGKPRVFMPYIGGMPAYREKCEEVVATGYAGFMLAV